MLKWFKQLDTILRGDATSLSSLADAEIKIPVGGLSIAVLLLGAVYGSCAGSFAMIQTAGQAYKQFIASTIKLPMLFFLTLVVTFPSLYVFNALIGTRLSIVSVLRLLVAALGVMLAVLASLGPIVVFFGLSTKNYPFMVLLNVATSTTAGVLGLKFLLHTLDRLVIVQQPAESPKTHKSKAESNASAETSSQDKSAEPTAAIEPAGDAPTVKAKSVFTVWTVVFALVGAQMSWVLRPLIGCPGLPFELFRERESNFFIAVAEALLSLFSP